MIVRMELEDREAEMIAQEIFGSPDGQVSDTRRAMEERCEWSVVLANEAEVAYIRGTE